MGKKAAPWILIGLLAGACAGCNVFGYLGYLVAPVGRTRIQEAEFDEFPGRKIAVVVFAGEYIRYDYPAASLNVSWAVSEELRRKVKDVSTVPPERIARYQEENIHWDTLDKTKLGKALGADYVLLIALGEFTTIEPGSTNLFRGIINCQLDVYEVSKPEPDARVYEGGDLRVIYPPDAPAGRPKANHRTIVRDTTALLARRLVKKFYKHKVPKEP